MLVSKTEMILTELTSLQMSISSQNPVRLWHAFAS